MSKITKEMVEYWLGENTKEEAISVILEIANSVYDKKQWTPKILNNDILSTYDINIKNKGNDE